MLLEPVGEKGSEVERTFISLRDGNIGRYLKTLFKISKSLIYYSLLLQDDGAYWCHSSPVEDITRCVSNGWRAMLNFVIS